MPLGSLCGAGALLGANAPRSLRVLGLCAARVWKRKKEGAEAVITTGSQPSQLFRG